MTRRGSARRGQPAKLPSTTYDPPSAREPAQDGLRVVFQGEDGRRTTFHVDRLPLSGWHHALAEVLAARVGLAGTARTLASADFCWQNLGRFIRALAQLPAAPQRPEDLLRGHIERHIARRAATLPAPALAQELTVLAGMLRLAPLSELLRPDALEPLHQQRRTHHSPAKPGYTDAELDALIHTARRDTAVIRDRLDAAEALLAIGKDPHATTDHQLERDWLKRMADAGAAPEGKWPNQPLQVRAARRRLAAHLFLIWPDLTPLMVLLVALTGRNVESIKELPAEHRVLEGRAVELTLTKRRRGSGRWQQTVTWEIGPPHRALHTPGGLYLLVLRLTARSRRFSGSTSLWSIWRNGSWNSHSTGEHIDPFRAALSAHSSYNHRWKVERPDGAPGPTLDFIRLKTSIEVRRTRQMGGHLPSAARSNTYSVLFSSYLRDDPTTLDWTREIIDEALVDAETAALDAHRRILATSGGGSTLAVTEAQGSHAAEAGASPSDTGWVNCADPQRHPSTRDPCRSSSLLDCFHCANAVVTPAHLPRLLDLLDAFDTRAGQLSDEEWWSRYGPAWAAIRHDVLSRFSPAELDQARTEQPGDALLDLVENPWEHP